MQFVIEHELVHAGDVILSSEGTPRSKGIRVATKSNFSHAMICVGVASYVHAHGPGVEIANPQRDLFDGPSRVKILRYTGPDVERVVSQACKFVRQRIGTQYSVPEAIGTRVKKARRNLTNRQFCSRLVAQAYASAGVSLVEDPDYCSPQELNASPFLREVTGCMRVATAAEIAFANESDQPLATQAWIINTFLKEAREITGKDLQSISQVEAHLLEDGKHDRQLSEALVRSGYLLMWKTDVDRNGWRYDKHLFEQSPFSPAQKPNIAKREIELAMADAIRFDQSRAQVTEWLKVANRQFFRLERDLYALLVDLHIKRYEAAKYAQDKSAASHGK